MYINLKNMAIKTKTLTLILLSLTLSSIIVKTKANDNENENNDNEITSEKIEQNIQGVDEIVEKESEHSHKPQDYSFDESKYSQFSNSVFDPEGDFWFKENEITKEEVESKYENTEDISTREMFREARLYERKYIDHEVFRVLCYRILIAHHGEATQEERYYYAAIIEEILTMAPPIIPIEELDAFLVGENFGQAVENVMMKHFGKEGLETYKQAMKEEL